MGMGRTSGVNFQWRLHLRLATRQRQRQQQSPENCAFVAASLSRMLGRRGRLSVGWHRFFVFLENSRLKNDLLSARKKSPVQKKNGRHLPNLVLRVPRFSALPLHGRVGV